jgi:hypothetical protein
MRPSRSVLLVLGVVGLVLLLALGFFSTVLWPGFLAPSPSSSKRAQAVASLKADARRAFGDNLESVSVRYGRYIGVPTYFGEFRLKGVPLRFRFQPTASELDVHGLSSAALIDNSAIGGTDRFLKLASAYHRDFPDEEAMYYWKVDYPGELPAPVQQRLHPQQPAVTVYDRNDFWEFASTATELGLYSWNPETSAWDLVNRGAVPGAR